MPRLEFERALQAGLGLVQFAGLRVGDAQVHVRGGESRLLRDDGLEDWRYLPRSAAAPSRSLARA